MSAESKTGRRALLVEDDPMVLRLLTEVAASAGLQPVPCRSLTAARGALRAYAPAVIVVDEDLPDGHGADLVREVQATPRWRRTRVVFCTSAEPWRQRILARMAPVIGKPFRIGEVERVLREAAEA